MNIILQVDPSKRPKLEDYDEYSDEDSDEDSYGNSDDGGLKSDEILKVLESLASKIRNNPKIEADWLSFHSLIKVSAVFKVDQRTLSSRDLFKEITQMNLNVKSGQMATGGTEIHDQKDTNLCAYFATMSALRHQLRKIVETEISEKDTSKIRPKRSWEISKRERQEKQAQKYARLKIKEYLERLKDEKRFERDLAVMIGCVSPRSLSARFKITY